jgi:hypothetical protein
VGTGVGEDVGVGVDVEVAVFAAVGFGEDLRFKLNASRVSP